VPLAQEVSLNIPAHELIGRQDAPVVVTLGGISADRHICGHRESRGLGWWEPIAGSGRALDTSCYRLLGCDHLDGGIGVNGRPERIVSTHDQAAAIAAALDHLEIERVHAFVGASYGGMVALAFAERYPDRLERLVVIGAAHRTHPMITALRVIQRRVVELGLDAGNVHEALVLARALGTTTYRTAREFAQRFAAAPEHVGESDATFPVESYLRLHGERFAARFTPARFLALSLSSDLHSVDPSRIRTPATLVAIEDDAIAPRHQIDELAALLGAPSHIAHLETDKGHDAFLTDADALRPILHAALS
jgi:homoserine O-acetyltransferase/O-succinyltransferase